MKREILRLGLAAAMTALTITAPATVRVAMQPDRVINIVNFVRLTEPRSEAVTDDVLYRTTEAQYESMKRNGLKGTFLLQYDALINPRYQTLMRQAISDGFEVGGWWEITEPHVKAAGMNWRGRYPWDWHANVGFATGYTPAERLKLVDVYMAEFKRIFGRYPASVGSWFIDAVTLRYMADKYHITASCNCRDQVGTDGYTMWGGYWQGGYYPSLLNAYLPAQNKSAQINVPVFRMLGSDPLYQYYCGVGGATQSVSTLEPVYGEGGGSERWTDWYLGTVSRDPALGFVYVQAGQENSFTWGAMRRGFEMQMPKLAALARSGEMRVLTLEETGREFRSRYKITPATASTAMSDYTPQGGRTVWYSTRYYRTSLFWQGERFLFRDIQLYNEHFKSLYYDQPGTSTECHYYALPLVDGCLWSKGTFRAGLRIMSRDASGGEYKEIKCSGPTVTTAGSMKAGRMIVSFDGSGRKYRVELGEKGITVESDKDNDYRLELTVSQGAKLPEVVSHDAKTLQQSFNGFRYTMRVGTGSLAMPGSSDSAALWTVTAKNGKVTLSLAQR